MTSTTLVLSPSHRHHGARHLGRPLGVRRLVSRRTIWTTCGALALVVGMTIAALDFLSNVPSTLYDPLTEQVTPLLEIAFGNALRVFVGYAVGAFGVGSALAFTTMGLTGLRIERRGRLERRPLRIPVQVDSSEGSYEAVSENISVGGLFLATNREHAVGDKIRLSFQLPRRQERLSVEAEVRWVRRRVDLQAATPTGVGLLFLSSDWWFRDVLRRFLPEA
jgi:uncharacterized protein (TIGR02266 family)